MAFNFFGIYSTGQWESFLAFAKIQKMELRLRKRWLQAELTRNGIFTTQYDGDVAVSFTANGYAGKLLAAYKILGGVPERDLLLRTRDQPVFKTKGTNIGIAQDGTSTGGFSDIYSNGRRERGGQRFDRDLGLAVTRLKGWQLESIKFKRERLEYKIRKALDRQDELQLEIGKIDDLLNELSSRSFDSQVASIETTMATPNAANVVDDLDDVHGLKIGRVADLTFDDALAVATSEDQRGTTT
ncbi:MAG TPA: hypothetical protein VIE65_19900 [Methylobacter sp.]|jgi:hypothetical protein